MRLVGEIAGAEQEDAPSRHAVGIYRWGAGARLGWRHALARRAAALRHAGDERARPGPARRRARPCCTSPSARPGCRSCPASPSAWARRRARTATGRSPAPPRSREAAAGYFERRGLPTGPEQVLLAPGSKALLYALLCVLPGDVVLPRPSWVSYAAQAALAGKRVHRRPDRRARPAACRTPRPCARRSAPRGPGPRAGDPRPHAARQPDRHRRVGVADRRRSARSRREHGAADRVRRDLPRPRLRARRRCAARRRCSPERVFVTNGLSKSMALGGWRIGFCRAARRARSAPTPARALARRGERGVVEPRRADAARRRLRPRRAAGRASSTSPRSRRLHRLVDDRGARARSSAAGARAARRPAPSTSTPTSSRCARRWPRRA